VCEARVTLASIEKTKERGPSFTNDELGASSPSMALAAPNRQSRRRPLLLEQRISTNVAFEEATVV
jgi:hypothetical protein